MPQSQSGKKNSRNVHRKNIVRQHLKNRDISALEELARNREHILRTLSSLMYDRDPLVRWRAIEAMGKVSKVIFSIDSDKVRRQIRRILWLMNDESGGLCRNGPEAIGEIIFNVPDLLDEFGSILISFLNEEPFETGTRNAIARLGRLAPEFFADTVPVISKSLENEDPYIRGLSIKTLTAINDKSAHDTIETMTSDQHRLDDYDFESGKLLSIRIGDLAHFYINRPR